MRGALPGKPFGRGRSFRKMRKKNAGALFMDFHVSPDDRVGGQPQKKRAAAAPRRKRSPPKRAASSPASAASLSTVDDEPPHARQAGERAEAPEGQEGPRQAPAQAADPRAACSSTARLLAASSSASGAASRVAGVVAYFYVQLPSSNTWAVPDRPANIRILAADGQLISNRGKTGGEAVSLRELPHYVPAAFIAIEDRRFYEHFGVDVMGLMSVALESVQAGEITRGASTITQQLAKNLFLTPDQTLGRKVQETLLAVWLEQNYTKDDILELYLNRMFFGTDARAATPRHRGRVADLLRQVGAQPLARRSRDPRRLAPGALSPQPAHRRPRQGQGAPDPRPPGHGRAKATSREDEAHAAEIDPNQQIRTKVAGAEYYVADWVETLMQAYIGDVTKDVIVQTTINWDLQKQAEFVVREAVANAGQGARLHPGRAGRDGCRRHRARPRRRHRLRQEPVQPRRHRPPPARLGLQALRLSRRDGEGLHARHRRRRCALRLQRLEPVERLRQVRRPGDAARRARLFAQHRLRPPRHRCRPPDRWSMPRCGWASPRLWTPCPRSRSAPPKFRCSS